MATANDGALDECQLVCEMTNLSKELAFELNGVEAAYRSVLESLSLRPSNSSTAKHTATVLNQLAGLQRFLFQRLCSRLREASLAFARASGAHENQQCAEALCNLRKAVVLGSRVLWEQNKDFVEVVPATGRGKTWRFVFAISAIYSEVEQMDTALNLIQVLNKPVFILKPMTIQNEEEFALNIGCNILVTPRLSDSCAICKVTREMLLQFVRSHLGNERKWTTPQSLEDEEGIIDEELSALLSKLDESVGASPMLVQLQSMETQKHPGEVVPRGMLCGDDRAAGLVEENDSSESHVHWDKGTEYALRSVEPPTKRTRKDSICTVPQTCETVDSQGQLSQIIQYKHEAPLQSLPSLWDGPEDVTLDSSKWSFQLSVSVGNLKSRLIEAITRLGCHVDVSVAYNPKTTHFVVAEGVSERTEKYMGCCAALKCMVPPSYVFDSEKRGRWIIGALRDYERNPLLCRWKPPPQFPFCNWRVVIFACNSVVCSGIAAVLRAGSCKSVTSVCVDPRTGLHIDMTVVEQATHILVHCEKFTNQGLSILPSWLPLEVRKHRNNIFPLEILHHVLCSCTSPIFDGNGCLLDSHKLPVSCQVELPKTPAHEQ
ncbi:hypothetical protein ERJ75_001233800 [Trypanosoma vivax]|uniref:BRCT domain-containing protein n=1 Tax=Trypanosoma vivax (strain Y486) TaxID=1055687 RepID=G0U0T1_TRYVY|nr:hypothetical protein ERJ75_001233800 [Trypanosoma vivax]CCC49681.1 conserved hypothetical protein [Trypanosoma vivax Y486]